MLFVDHKVRGLRTIQRSDITRQFLHVASYPRHSVMIVHLQNPSRLRIVIHFGLVNTQMIDHIAQAMHMQRGNFDGFIPGTLINFYFLVSLFASS